MLSLSYANNVLGVATITYLVRRVPHTLLTLCPNGNMMRARIGTNGNRCILSA